MVATTNANESRARDNNFKQRDNHFKPKENKGNTNEISVRNNRNVSGNNGYKQRDYLHKGTGFNPSREKSNSSKEYSRNPYAYVNKDDDEDDRSFKGRKASEAKTKNSLMKDKDQQPDKLETMRRFEREKKAIQKKNRQEEFERSKRPIIKQKRSTKDLTKGYEYGLLGDEEDF